MKKLYPLIFLALGCGSGQEETQSIPQPVLTESDPSTQTPYGDSDQVQAYLNSINPFVQEVGKIQLEIDKMVGTSGQATGSNLAPAMEKLKPRLKQAIEEFNKLDPPPLMAPLHGDIKKLMVLRLDGYETTIRGWAHEQKDGSTDAYTEAENTLREANQLILKLNLEMGKVYQAMEQATKPTATASP